MKVLRRTARFEECRKELTSESGLAEEGLLGISETAIRLAVALKSSYLRFHKHIVLLLGPGLGPYWIEEYSYR